MGWFRKEELLSSNRRSLNAGLRAPIAVGLGAIAGALSRYYLSLGVNQWLGTTFPFATFLINISGAIVMGFFTTLVVERRIAIPELRLIVAVGFLGSYTTFSTYTLDLERLLTTGLWQLMTLYWIGSTGLGLLGLELGRYLAQKLLSKTNEV